jgi:transcriptional regulator with XRE-family HTH domain
MEIGEKIKELRNNRHMTLDELSKRSGVSISLLSMVERNRSAPTVRTLDRIVKAFGTTISNLYRDMENSSVDDTSSGRVTVIHKTDRKKLVLGPERARAHYELLTPDYRQKLQIMYIHYPVGRNEGEFISHEGEECGVILEGRLKAYVGDRTYILEDGGCIYLDSSIPHRWENIGEIEVRAFWINTPATF